MDDQIIQKELDSLSVSEVVTCSPEDCVKLLPKNSNKLTFLNQNIRSINHNFNSFMINLQRIKHECDILVLTECWLSSNHIIPPINGYKIYRTLTNPLQNDGVVTYVREDVKVTVEEPDFRDGNCLVLRLGSETAVVAIYRSPSYSNLDNFHDSLNSVLTNLKSFKNVAIIGDINIDICPENRSVKAHDYINLCASHGLLPAHSLPTRMNKTCLDHIILKTKYNALTLIFNTTVTDHETVMLSLNLKIQRIYSQINSTQINNEGLQNDLANIDLQPIYGNNDPHLAMEYLINSIHTALDKNTIVKKLSRRNKVIKPWITPGLLKCTRNRDRMHKNAKKQPNNQILNITYKRYRNFCNKLLKKIKRDYDKKIIEKAGNSNKKIWEAIKTITNTTKSKTSAYELLIQNDIQNSIDNVNQYFANIGDVLASKILQSNLDTPNLNSNNPPTNSFVLLDTDEDEVNNIITGLKNTSATGWDKIPNKLLKNYRKILIPHITYIFNNCLAAGTFPNCLKKSVIHPIHKTGDRDRVNNYRPISILPSISKILEKIINIRLINYLENNNLLSNCQFGFRPGKSTDDAVHELTNYVVGGLDNNNKIVGIFLDLAKAFDTVSIPILLNKLELLGIRGNQLKLFEDYLCRRQQCVMIDKYTSSDLPVQMGVPQGSILGPILFLIYIDDLLKLNLVHGKIISYADDTALLFSHKTWHKAFNAAQTGFNSVSHWLRTNYLTLNNDKTNYIAFTITNATQPSTDHKIVSHSCTDPQVCNLNCPYLTRISHTKYLGVILDQNLNFHQHIDNTAKRVRKLIYVFKNLRHVADPILVKRVYLALCQSIITYCITSWGGAAKTLLMPLEIAQRAVLKVCTFKPRLYPTNLVYEFCEVYTVRQLFIYSVLLRQHFLLKFEPQTLVKRRSDRICLLVKYKHAFMNRFFCCLAPTLYNKVNRILNIYPLPKHILKITLFKWLQKLNYDDTECLLSTFA